MILLEVHNGFLDHTIFKLVSHNVSSFDYRVFNDTMINA
jgi:hypothetical protein